VPPTTSPPSSRHLAMRCRAWARAPFLHCGATASLHPFQCSMDNGSATKVSPRSLTWHPLPLPAPAAPCHRTCVHRGSTALPSQPLFGELLHYHSLMFPLRLGVLLLDISPCRIKPSSSPTLSMTTAVAPAITAGTLLPHHRPPTFTVRWSS
jgi:hypothetical protein